MAKACYVGGVDFGENMPTRDELLSRLDAMDAAAKAGGGQERIDKRHEKGLMTARERLDLLLDPTNRRYYFDV